MSKLYYVLPLEMEKIEHYKKRKLEFDYIKPDYFEELAKQFNPIIIGDIKLKTTNDDVDVVVVTSNNKKFSFELINQPEKEEDYHKLRDKDTILGYVKIDGNTYVAVLKPSILLIILFFIGIGALICLLISLFCMDRQILTPDVPIPPNLEFEDGEDWDGSLPQNGEQTEASSETTKIPGYAELYVSTENPEIQLINPEGNTVYFIYTITDNDKEIYTTKAISPNTMIKVNFKDLLPIGEYNLQFAISTYDVETQEPCNGAVQEVKMIVKE